MTPNPYRQYQNTQVQTAGPAQLTLMCYDGALRFLNQAHDAIVQQDFETKHRFISRTQGLLTELLNGLDFERGGQIARNLQALYHFMHDRLTHADLRDDRAAIDDVRAMLTELRGAWAEAMKTAGPLAPAAARRDFALSV